MPEGPHPRNLQNHDSHQFYLDRCFNLIAAGGRERSVFGISCEILPIIVLDYTAGSMSCLNCH